MGLNINLKLDDLVVWSDNPRLGYNEKNIMSEKQAINVLIDVVGCDKMFNLAKSIVKMNGLAKNTLPVVVKQGKKYFVYDGNRRISCLKMMLNPSIISNLTLKPKIETLIKNKKLSYCNSIDVYCTDKNEALLLMDLTHTGERKGVGILQWDSFNRDLAFHQRGVKLIYPTAFSVASLLGWKKPKDFVIPYTDFERLFGAKVFLELFSIDSIDEKHVDEVKEAVTALQTYQKYRGFQSFSRFFNMVTTDTPDMPMSQFVSWVHSTRLARAEYIVRASDFTVFNDYPFNFDYTKILVLKNEEKRPVIETKPEDFSITYTNPSGRNLKSINLNVLGDWKANIIYKGILTSCKISVEKPVKEEVFFNENALKIKKGESLNFDDAILKKMSSHKNDMTYSTRSVGDVEAIIKNNVFSAENNIGEYDISFKFDNDGVEFSVVKKVQVINNVIPFNVNIKEIPFGNVEQINIDFSYSVSKLIGEINGSYNNPNIDYLIVASARSVIELCLDYLNQVVCVPDLNTTNDLAGKLNIAINYFKNEFNNFFKNTRLSYQNFRNQLDSIDVEKLNAVLNIGAHKAGSIYSKKYILSYFKNDITVFIICCQLIKNSSSHN